MWKGRHVHEHWPLLQLIIVDLPLLCRHGWLAATPMHLFFFFLIEDWLHAHLEGHICRYILSLEEQAMDVPFGVHPPPRIKRLMRG